MKILLTNDDGIDAPGLDALFNTVRLALGGAAEIVVVAPDQCRSECGHSVTTGRPLHVRQPRVGWFAVDGTPVDCVRVALASLAPETEMVVSGVNAGANLGVDLLVSGTFAAAREAAIEGVAAMAVSHYRRPDVPVTWDHVPRWLAPILDEFSELSDSSRKSIDPAPVLEEAMLWNVNLPAIDPTSAAPPHVRCLVDSCPMIRTARSAGERLHFESDFHGRPRRQGSDVERCFSGQITISELSPLPL